MSQENVKPEQIQASVAAALSRLRGDAAPPSDAPEAAPPTATPPSGPSGMTPGMAGMGARPEPLRPEPPRAANDLRADPGLRPVPASPMPPSIMQAGGAEPPRPAGEPPAAKEPELPRAMFSRPGPVQSGQASSDAGGPVAAPEPERAPTVQRPASPLARMMTRDPSPAGDAAKAGAPTVDKGAAPEQQPDLLAGLPPPPLGDALTQEADDNGARRRRNRRILALVAAIVVIVAGFWLWNSGGGDPADVPVIAAEATPEKVKPADEGGLQVPNQNVQVLDNMNSGEQAAESETVLPPPEQPVAPPEPSVADAAQPEAPAVVDSGSAAVEDVPAVSAPAVTAPEPEPTTAEAPAAQVPVAPEPAPEPTQQQAEPTQQAEAPAAPAVAAPEPEPAAPAPEAAAAPESTPEPAPTPEPAATQEAAVAPAPAPAAVGNSRIQLAAVKSEDSAKAEWAKMQKAHPDLLGNLTLTVERVDKNGTIFYRIQAGPLADKAAAKDLCASLKSRGQDCIVAR